MGLKALLSGSSHNKRKELNQKLYKVLTDERASQASVVRSALADAGSPKLKENDDSWNDVAAGRKTLNFEELAAVLSDLQAKGKQPEARHFNLSAQSKSPFASQAFYDFIRKQKNENAIPALQEQLKTLRRRAKKKQGFISKAFNIFSKEKPIEEVTKDVFAFEKYCRKHKISFNEVTSQLEGGDWENPAWKKIKDFRFLLAAVGGAMVGLAGNMCGVDLLSHVPDAVNQIPSLFFQGLPYMALPFISLSIFKAFSKKSLLKEAPTLGRFVGTMAIGILVGLGVTAGLSGILPDLSAATEVVDRTAGGEGGFSPSKYILHGIGLSAVFASLYRKTKKKLGLNRDKKEKKKSFLKRAFNTASGAVNQVGRVLDKAAKGMDKLFDKYMNIVGIPAIGIMMTDLLNKGGFAELANYGGYYAVMGTCVAACAAVLGGLAYAHGCRKQEFKDLAKTGTTAFSISSSAATMPVTKQSLKNMGVPSHIRESVVPLGANFNMMGTAMFLGGTAVAASYMLGLDPTFGQMLGAMGIAVSTAFGAPGAPASMIIFLDPVLAKMGLSPHQAEAVYSMVIPGERPLDMTQTALNVTGDQIVGLNTEAYEKNKGVRRLLPFRRDHPKRNISTPGPENV